MKGPSYKLYNCYTSSSSWRVRIAMNLKKIPYEYVSIDIQEKNELIKLPQWCTPFIPCPGWCMV